MPVVSARVKATKAGIAVVTVETLAVSFSSDAAARPRARPIRKPVSAASAKTAKTRRPK
jgi:hypothetical protein